MLHLRSLTYRIAGRTLLDGADAHIPADSRVGLVGRNGTGKTTLFRLILGELSPDGGDIVLRPRARVGTVAQEAPEGDMPVLDCVLAADTERASLLAELEVLETQPAEDPQTAAVRMADIHERLDAIGAHAAPARAATILSGLGFPVEAQSRPVGDYSGGWRMRVALAAALFARPDLLLLDEPTNHLDLEATLWLETFLSTYPGTLLIISHDRDLLNTAVNRILHLENNGLTGYGGNWSRFERTRREQAETQRRAAVKQAAERKHLEAFVERFRAKATKARQAQSRLKRLEKMGPVEPVVEEKRIPFDFPDPDPLPPPILTLSDAGAAYGPVRVLSKLNLRLDMDDRIALLGPNGNGKSTLAKLIAGQMEPAGGSRTASPKLKIGFFAQHQMDTLRPGETALGHGRRLMAEWPEARIRSHLGRFGFGEERVHTKVEALSGGEKARLVIALICREAPHLLILDEPTNHLDIDSRDSLVEALTVFGGAVLLISHDPHLVSLVADRLWLVDRGTVTPYDGDMDDYRAFLLERAREAKRSGSLSGSAEASTANGGSPSDSSGTSSGAIDRKDRKRAAAEARSRLAPLRKAVQAAEKTVERLSQEKAAVDAQLADPELYDGPADKISALTASAGDLAKRLEQAEEAWMDAEEALDTATAAEPALAS